MTPFEPEIETFTYRSDDGLLLSGRIHGANHGGTPIICLPGLTRNSRDFHHIAQLLAADGRRVVALDYRGRGLSDWDPNPTNYTVLREAQDVIAALGHLGIGRATFIGTSRGGLILHVLGAMAPDILAGIVLNDIGPVIEIEGLRIIQRYLGARPKLSDMAQAARALKTAHGEEFPALAEADWRDMAEAIFRVRDGVLQSDFDPAIAQATQALDLSQPLPDLWPQFDALTLPMLIIRGENSRLLSAATTEEMLRRHPGAALVTAEGQGHAPILHHAAVAGSIRQFLSTL